MRILMLTQWFDPEPFFKGIPFAKELSALGHDVEVLTGFPNYPGGKVYQGYRVRPFQRELIDGIRINRVALYPSHDKSRVRRAINYLSFALSATFIGTFLVSKADVAYVYHPPATIGLPALALKWFRKIPYVYDVQDLWPDTVGVSGMINSSIVFWLIDRWCRFVYRQSEKVVVLSPGFKRELQERGVRGEKIEVIYNWCNEESLDIQPRKSELSEELGLNETFNIMFAGNIGKAQGLESVLDAASIIEKRFPEIRFVFVGSGVELHSLKSKAQKMSLGNVLFLGRRSLEEIGEVLSLADVLLVHLKPDPLFQITIPSKTQTYMHVQKPILMAVSGDAASIVEEAGAGVSCVSGDARSIASAAERLYSMPKTQLEEMGKSGREYYKTHMSRSVSIKRFEDIFKEAANGKRES
jgi:colanic acid biosynthesis glycosyl transferase WcaI